ncbi:MAG: prevent-host-death protein [Oscillospiraceae bacterium]|nr:prevent-host-death protein [Oscillospiraceae bacterium]
MPIIKPVTDLQNYNDVLRDIAVGEPVFLTENGRGRYVIIEMREYERQQAELQLLCELMKADESVKAHGWLTQEEVERELGLA